MSRILLPILLLLAACRTPPGEPSLAPLPPPSGPGALAPRLQPGSEGEVLLTWLEPAGRGHVLRLSRLAAGATDWSPPETVVAGPGFFANWADLPGVAADADGVLLAHWLQKLGEDPYAYAVHLASRDREGRWTPGGLLHTDASPAEHGFVAWAPHAGRPRAFWLDGRSLVARSEMELRTVRPGLDGEVVLDGRVCECCAVDAAATGTGVVVVYRDRDPGEVRDIAAVRSTAGGWSEPVIVHPDGWTIAGCPVNGPAVDAAGDRVVVAWFTGAGEQPRVLAAWSEDGGATFGAPQVVDDRSPAGRVDVVLDGGGDAVVTWIGQGTAGTAVRARRLRPGSAPGAPLDLVSTASTRAAGFPRAARQGGDLVVAWPAEGPSIRAGRIALQALPAAGD